MIVEFGTGFLSPEETGEGVSRFNFLRLLRSQTPKIRALKFFREVEMGKVNIDTYSIPHLRKLMLQSGMSKYDVDGTLSDVYINRMLKKD